MNWAFYPGINLSVEALGFIPSFLHEDDPRPAKEQINERYAHGGGWRPMKGFRLNHVNLSIVYPGDPPHKAIASAHLRTELIVVYDGAWVAIIQPDNSFEVARLD